MSGVRVRRHTLTQGAKVATIDPLDIVARPEHLNGDLRVHVFAAAGSIELVASPVRLSLSDARALRDALDRAIDTVEAKLAEAGRAIDMATGEKAHPLREVKP